MSNETKVVENKVTDENGTTWGFVPWVDEMDGQYLLGMYDPENYTSLSDAINSGALYSIGETFYCSTGHSLTTADHLIDSAQLAAKCLGRKIKVVFGLDKKDRDTF